MSADHRLPDYLDHMQQAAKDAATSTIMFYNLRGTIPH